MITLGEFIDLIDNNRESEEIVNIMNCNGKKEVKAMVCSGFWDGLESRTVNSIQAENSELNIWLNDEVKQ